MSVKKINNLNIERDLKDSLCNILLNEDDEDQEDLFIITITNSDDNHESSDDQSSDDHNPSQTCEEGCDCDIYFIKFMGLEINVIFKEEKFILDLIDQINDPIEKRKVIEHYITIASNMVKEPNESKLVNKINQEKELYSYNKILERANQKEKEPSLYLRIKRTN